jgi:hypothetical protein
MNGGDEAKLRGFVAEHFLIEPGTPPADQRATRMLGTHGNLGALSIVTLDQTAPGTVEATLDTANEGRATMAFIFDSAELKKIKALQIMVGG